MLFTKSFGILFFLCCSLSADVGQERDGFPLSRLFNFNRFSFVFPLSEGSLYDDSHIELDLSLRYPITPLGELLDEEKYQLDFIYNLQLDFYAINKKRYDSKPIVSRLQNPGIQLTRQQFIWPDTTFTVGFFHESNGQTLDFETLAQFNTILYAPRGGLERALAETSRSWNYISLGFQKELFFGGNSYKEIQFHSELRTYLPGREEDLFWNPNGPQPAINDFDGLRLKFQYDWNADSGFWSDLTARVQLKTGTRDFDALGNVSYEISLSKKLGNNAAWFTVFYSNGYGKEPSTYHLRSQYIGIGLEFR